MNDTEQWWDAAHVAARSGFDRTKVDRANVRARLIVDAMGAASFDEAQELSVLVAEVDDPHNDNRALSIAELLNVCAAALDEPAYVLLARVEERAA